LTTDKGSPGETQQRQHTVPGVEGLDLSGGHNLPGISALGGEGQTYLPIRLWF